MQTHEPSCFGTAFVRRSGRENFIVLSYTDTRTSSAVAIPALQLPIDLFGNHRYDLTNKSDKEFYGTCTCKKVSTSRPFYVERIMSCILRAGSAIRLQQIRQKELIIWSPAHLLPVPADCPNQFLRIWKILLKEYRPFAILQSQNLLAILRWFCCSEISFFGLHINGNLQCYPLHKSESSQFQVWCICPDCLLLHSCHYCACGDERLDEVSKYANP